MGLRKVAIALLVALVALSALVPLALYGQSARALNTVTVTLKVVPGIYYNYVPLESWGLTGNASYDSLSLAGAKFLVEVEYTNGTIYSTQLVTVNQSGYISFAVPYNTPVNIFLNVSGYYGTTFPVGAIYDATFTSNTVSNISVAVSVYPVPFYTCNGSKVVIKLAEAWTYNQSAGPAIASGLYMVPTAGSHYTVMLPFYYSAGTYSFTIAPATGDNALASFIVAPNYATTYWYWALGKNVSVTKNVSNGFPLNKNPAGVAWSFLNGSQYLVGVVVHFVMREDLAPTGGGTYYLLYDRADAANDTAYMFIPVNTTTGWAVFLPWINMSAGYGYLFSAVLITTFNESLPVFTFYNLTGKGYLHLTPLAFATPTLGLTSIPYNKTLTVKMTGPIYSFNLAVKMANASTSPAEWYNGTNVTFLEVTGPGSPSSLTPAWTNVSAAGIFYANVTNGFVPMWPAYNAWPFGYGKKIIINGKVYALALNSTFSGYISVCQEVPPALYAYGTQIYYQAYKLSNSTSSTAYVVIKGKVTTLYGNFTVPNGTVEVIVDNGNTNVYSVNASVEDGTFSSPALELSPTTNYTYELVYYNDSKAVLPSDVSGTNVVFSGTPSSFATLTVTSTTTTTTTTTTSTTTTTTTTSTTTTTTTTTSPTSTTATSTTATTTTTTTTTSTTTTSTTSPTTTTSTTTTASTTTTTSPTTTTFTSTTTTMTSTTSPTNTSLTTTTNTTTTSPTSTTTTNWIIEMLAIIFLLLILLAIVAGARGAKHAIVSQDRKYVKEDSGDYITEG